MAGVGTAFATVFLWLAISLVFGCVALRIVTAVFEKELQLWEGITLLGVVVLLLGLAIKLTGNLWLLLLLLLLVGAAMLAVQYVPAIVSRRNRREMWEADIVRFQNGIDFDPKNVAAYSFLGDTYMKLGRLDEAIESYRKAVELEPNQTEEKKKLERALAVQATSTTREMLCPRCRLPRARGEHQCASCGRPFSYDETFAYNLRRTPRWQVLGLMLAGLTGLGLAIGVGMVGLPTLGWMIALIVLAVSVSVVAQLAKWK